MKLVVFAHTPPPMHGQSYMVGLTIKGLGGDWRRKSKHEGEPREIADISKIRCFHVNARFSNDLPEVGSFKIRKIFHLAKYCLEAIWCRFRYGADAFYYIPAPPKRVAFYRDCLVLALCRLFFRRLIFHWEASGLAEWLQRDAFAWERWSARFLLGAPDLSITLASSLSNDAVYFQSKRIQVVPNAIADPCPTFEKSVLPRRIARFTRRQDIFETRTASPVDQERYKVVFLAHCTREKGLFIALEAIALVNQQLDSEQLSIRMHLTVAGAFLSESEHEEFETWNQNHPDQVDYVGFVSDDAKVKLLEESDCLCFPTYYSAEAQPVSIIEAMAFGLTIVASAWRGIPELLPTGYPFLISERGPSVIARALVESMKSDLANELRLRYCAAFTEDRYVKSITQALSIVDSASHH